MTSLLSYKRVDLSVSIFYYYFVIYLFIYLPRTSYSEVTEEVHRSKS